MVTGEVVKVEGVKKLAYAPLLKTGSNRYLAVLSDTGLDRDEEFIGKKFLERAAKTDFLPGLINHENDVLGLVCEWVNKRVEKKGDHYALVAEPKFYMSNPRAQIIKGMLDEGARVGISITAIPNSKRNVEVEGKSYTEWSDGEMLSADWVGIQSNRSSFGEAVIAKNFEVAKKYFNDFSEVESMEQENMDKSFDAEAFKKEVLAEVSKTVSESLAKNEESRLDILEKKLASIVDSLTIKKSEGSEEPAAEEEGSEEDVEKKAESTVKKASREEKLAELSKTPSVAGNSQVEQKNKGFAVDYKDVSVDTFLKIYNGKLA